MPRPGSIPYLLGNEFHRLAYVEFGNPAAPAIVCVHGLTRNGRDFDPLAEALSGRYHVICPDLPGRGRSDWLRDAAQYQPASYVTALAHLLAALNKPVAWIGTSLGGICGMMAAAAADTPLTRLVLNDIGPHIPAAALAHIRDYMAAAPERFASLAALQAYLSVVHAPFGPLTEADWARLARHSHRQVLDGTGAGAFALHYDPKLAEPVRDSVPLDIDLWPTFEAIKIPVMVIRGARSELLLEETLARMRQAGAASHTVADAGHAPALIDAPTIAEIAAFLRA